MLTTNKKPSGKAGHFENHIADEAVHILVDYAAIVQSLRPLTSRLRLDVTAKKLATGASVWTDEPLTDARLLKHLNGGPARGCAFIKPGESMTLVSTLDLDSHKGEVSWSDMAAIAERLVDALEAQGLHPLAFVSSGGNGIHIISIWDEPQDAYSVRQLMRATLVSLGFADGTGGIVKGQIEVFPKQDQVAIGDHGNQCILPLAGQSVPLEPVLGMERMPKEYALSLEWKGSKPVPVLVKPLQASSTAGAVDLDELRAALEAIPNSGGDALDYEKWRDVIFGIHHATGGSADGLAMAHDFSKKAEKYDADFLNERTWPYVKAKPGGITGKTVLAMAREAGWAGAPEVFQAVATKQDAPEPLPKFKRDKNGAIEPTSQNLLTAMLRPDLCGFQLRHDTFREEVMLAAPETEGWRSLKDTDYMRLSIELERIGFKCVPKEKNRDAVNLAAEINAFDSAKHWLDSLVWDGVPRVAQSMPKYFGTDDRPYTREIGKYLWTALAGRVLKPGIKADMVPVAVGGQGLMKSSTIKAISPAEEFFHELHMGDDDVTKARLTRGKLVCELGELKGMYAKQVEDVKSYLSRTHDKWTPKFKEMGVSYARRFVCFGSTNDKDILKDSTGARRFLPFNAGRCDPVGMERDHQQLWAEGAVIFKAEGVLYREAENLAGAEHAEFSEIDPWVETVQEWLQGVDPISGEIPGNRPHVLVNDVLREAMGFDNKGLNQAVQNRVVKVLKELGYQQKKLKTGRVYVKA